MAEQSPSRAGQPAEPRDLVDVAHLVTAYYTGVPDPDDIDQQVAFGTSGHRGTSLRTAFNETHILATTQAICDYRTAAGVRRPAVHRPRHPRPLRAGLGDRARGAGRQRRDRPRRRPRPVHPDAGGVPRDPARQPRQDLGPGRRHRRDAVAQPALRRRLQVQPAARRPGRHRRHLGDRGPRQRADRRRACATSGASRSPGLGRPRRRTTSWGRTSTTCRTCSTWPRSARPGCGSAPTRWAARASTTGARSASGTASS